MSVARWATGLLAGAFVLTGCVTSPEWNAQRDADLGNECQMTVYKNGQYIHQGERKLCSNVRGADCAIYQWDYVSHRWRFVPQTELGLSRAPSKCLPPVLTPAQIGWPSTSEIGEDLDHSNDNKGGQP